MEVKTDYQAFVAEVKERNRLFLALRQVREIALNTYNKDIPEELKEQFKLILQKCDEGLRKSK